MFQLVVPGGSPVLFTTEQAATEYAQQHATREGYGILSQWHPSLYDGKVCYGSKTIGGVFPPYSIRQLPVIA